jgi:hypothetical protein
MRSSGAIMRLQLQELSDRALTMFLAEAHDQLKGELIESLLIPAEDGKPPVDRIHSGFPGSTYGMKHIPHEPGHFIGRHALAGEPPQEYVNDLLHSHLLL